VTLVQGDLKEKLILLKKVGKINEFSVDYLLRIDLYLTTHYQSSDNSAFLLHLAMAINRASNQQTIDPMSDDLWRQITQRKCFLKAKSLWSRLAEKAPVHFSEMENRYILLHLTNIVGRNQNG
jgi:transcriptional regulatory protein LevR